MHFLIDGYNLLHAMGVMNDRFGPEGLAKARLRLLGLLAGVYEPQEARSITVVFDAARGAPGGAAEQEYRGIRVLFAVRYPEADDLIEWLIGHDSAPKNLRVVSDDHRIQQTARHRRCTVVSCDEYLAWLGRHRRERRTAPPDPAAKPDQVPETEARDWLEKFGGLEQDPELKAFFEMDRFEIDEE